MDGGRCRIGSWTSWWPFLASYMTCGAWGWGRFLEVNSGGKWVFSGEIFLPSLGWRY